jgi:hypothetical protein
MLWMLRRGHIADASPLGCQICLTRASLSVCLDQCGFLGTPLGLGLATATTSAAFFPHLEQRIRDASSCNVTFQPTRRARACGVISRQAPHSHTTLTRKSPKQSSSRLM